MIKRHGFPSGYELPLQLMPDGMHLCPTPPDGGQAAFLIGSASGSIPQFSQNFSVPAAGFYRLRFFVAGAPQGSGGLHGHLHYLAKVDGATVWSGFAYTLESSTDLANWTQRARFTVTAETASLDFPATPAATNEFWRVALDPFHP